MRIAIDFPSCFRAKTQGPDAADIASALVKAARATGELAYLREHPTACLTGTMALRARWIAFAALRTAWPRCLHQMGRRWGGGAAPSVSLARARKTSWWDEAAAMAIAFDLRDAHEG